MWVIPDIIAKNHLYPSCNQMPISILEIYITSKSSGTHHKKINHKLKFNCESCTLHSAIYFFLEGTYL